MSTLAIINPTSLLGKELQESLARRPDLWRELKLISTDPEGAGAITEVAGAASLVSPLEDDSLLGTDLVFLCGPVPTGRESEILAALPEGVPAVLLAVDEPPLDAVPVVAGVNLEKITGAPMLVSPHAATVAIAHLLHPLRAHKPREVIGWVAQPTSVQGEAAMDELFEQTRAILSFSSERPAEVLGHQLAFNLLPAPGTGLAVARDLEAVLGAAAEISVEVIQAPIFHCLTVHLWIRFKDRPSVDQVRSDLELSPEVELFPDPELLGPIDGAGGEQLLVGAVREVEGSPGGFWIHAVMDNLTRGSALNAVEIAESLLTPQG